jgi:hypothetical protein
MFATLPTLTDRGNLEPFKTALAWLALGHRRCMRLLRLLTLEEIKASFGQTQGRFDENRE